ncbi:MAG: magnesium/cobalt transporter CorA [Lewinellaceae bacterium]|nr:magnesium/cobalt transporter CorA [Lewinellaceae bacterium]
MALITKFTLSHLKMLDTQQRSKLEEFDNGLFFIVHHLKVDCTALEIHSEQIALFAGKKFPRIVFRKILTTHLLRCANVAKTVLGGLEKGSDYLAYALLDLVVDSYYSVLDELETQALEVETSLHSNGALQTTKARMFALKRVFNEFRHRILPLREAVTRLYRTESDLVEDSTRLYLRDLVDHVAQILDGIDNQRDMLSNLEALFQAEAANRLNTVMRLLTVISTIFIPLTFIVGIYGMNFDYLPELHWHYGYFIVLGIMFCLMIGMLIYFRKKRWI